MNKLEQDRSIYEATTQDMSQIARNVLSMQAFCYMMLVTSRTGSWQPSGPIPTAAQPSVISFLSQACCILSCNPQSLLTFDLSQLRVPAYAEQACMYACSFAKKPTTKRSHKHPKRDVSTQLSSQVDSRPLFHVYVYTQTKHIIDHQTSLTLMYRTAACTHLHTTSIATKAYMACHLLLRTIPKLSFSPS